MIKYLFTFFFMILCTLTKGQNVSLDELISLRAKSLRSIGEFLVEKGWSVTRITEQTKTTDGYMSLHYNPSGDVSPSPYINIGVDVSLKPAINYLIVFVPDQAIYDSYMSRLFELGYKFSDAGENILGYKTDKSAIFVKQIALEENKYVFTLTIYDIVAYRAYKARSQNKK